MLSNTELEQIRTIIREELSRRDYWKKVYNEITMENRRTAMRSIYLND